jgi:hypothetical protein
LALKSLGIGEKSFLTHPLKKRKVKKKTSEILNYNILFGNNSRIRMYKMYVTTKKWEKHVFEGSNSLKLHS